MKQHFLILLLQFSMVQLSFSQDAKIVWDNTMAKKWPEKFSPVEIKSTVDEKIQKAIFYKSQLPGKQPLIVSLHTWSGNYLQEDPIAGEVALRGWNYIHPDFRGPNNNPEACGSELVIQDIEDAIQFVIQTGNVDTDEIHVIGVSGGGYATLLSFMKLKFPVKSFSAWASISDLEDWYWECKGRNLKYARDLEGVTTGGKEFDRVEARKRSPLLMPFPAVKRIDASLHIYTGIHDGYTGSVPVTHSVNMYNKLLANMYPEQQKKGISDSLQLELLSKRTTLDLEDALVLGGRKVHLYRELAHLSLTIFEGGHEMIVPQALALIPVNGMRDTQKLNILTIGDSNGANENGWPAQLRKLLPFSTIVNKSISGNTIGFDNLDQEKLNTLKNIDRYLDEAKDELGADRNFDMILIGLGTNDTKKIFENKQTEVPKNLGLLLEKIQNYFKKIDKEQPAIFVIAPPPMEEEKADPIKYGGGNKRIELNNMQFQEVANEKKAIYIDINAEIEKCGAGFTTDGVHLTNQTQFKMAEIIFQSIQLNK